MSRHKILAVILVFVLALVVSLSANTVNAQTNPAAGCTSTDYLAPVLVLNNSLSTLDYTKPDAVGTALVSLITLRNQYEDTVPAEGCESMKPVLIRFLALRIDVIYAQLAAKGDAANASAYQDIIATGFTRFQAAGKTLNDTVTTLTFQSEMPTEISGEAAVYLEVCSDDAFIAQLQASRPDLTAINGLDYTSVIKARYQVEDLQVPNGCGEAQSLAIQLLTNIEDQVVLAMMVQIDSANADTYTKFSKETVIPHYTTVQDLILTAIPSEEFIVSLPN